MVKCNIFQDDCEKFLKKYEDIPFDVSFLDPPFNQSKKYNTYQDKLPESLLYIMTFYISII